MKNYNFTILFIVFTVFLNAQTPQKLWSTFCTMNYSYNSQIDFSDDSRYFAIGNKTGTVTIYDAVTGEVSDSYKPHNSEVLCVAFYPYDDLIASADAEGNIVLYNYHFLKKKVVKTIYVTSFPILSICFSPDGRFIYAAGKNKKIEKYLMPDGKFVNASFESKNEIKKIVIAPDKNWILAGTSRVYDALEFYYSDALRNDYGSKIDLSNIQGMDISPDGSLLAVATLEKSVYLWNLKNKTLEYKLEGHKKWLGDVAFSPVGNLLASSGDDKTVRIWDLKTRQNVAIITGQKSFMAVRFSPNGKFIAAMNEDCTVGVWDVSTYLNPENKCLRKRKGFTLNNKYAKEEYNYFLEKNKIKTDENGNVVFEELKNTDLSKSNSPEWINLIQKINSDLKKYGKDSTYTYVVSYVPADTVFKIQSRHLVSEYSTSYADCKAYKLFPSHKDELISIRSVDQSLYHINYGYDDHFNFQVIDKVAAELIVKELWDLFALLPRKK